LPHDQIFVNSQVGSTETPKTVNLPQRTNWTPENWTAGSVLANCYVQGPKSGATVSTLLNESSAAIKSPKPFEVEGVHVDKDPEERPKKKRKLMQRDVADMRLKN
jgi:hypothetical protein